MNIVKKKKYNLLSNIFYVYRGVAKHKPYLIALLLISVVCTAGSKYIWLFLSKYIIEYISNGMEAGQLIRIVVILTVSNIVCMIGQNAVNFGKEPAAFYVRPMFMLERNKKHIGMFYENLEIREVLDAVERSKASTRNTNVGIEGMIRFTLDRVLLRCVYLYHSYCDSMQNQYLYGYRSDGIWIIILFFNRQSFKAGKILNE